MNCMKFFKYFIIDYRNVLRVQSLFCWRREDLKGIQPCFFSFKSIIENPKMKVRIFCIKISISGVSLFIHQSLFLLQSCIQYSWVLISITKLFYIQYIKPAAN